ncbi:sorbosone dehydrogenase [Nitrospira sp. KM1]|uniref:PQQ-dependent sugar dehydrogenase n=1 Tax=Nitrospira sp. KM1 TaxID=1936990 RepID=UPI0013A77DB8|nr:sorbosone dehydrogenase family protein [Nitrospira sp. KM1]BCA55258.1 sorbosone dehydrogenase [Nitrospira sp. KM1]
MLKLACAVVVCLIMSACRLHAGTLPLDKIKLPPGFAIAIYADNVPNARGMVLGQSGTLFVGSKTGDVYAVIDHDHDHRADEVKIIARDLNMPVGVAYRDGSLYVSAVDRILRFERIEQRLSKPSEPVVVTDRFPSEKAHGWKFIAFGPDGKLYVPVGAPCNICEPDPDRYALIGRMNLDGSGYEVIARGVRNSVGFDWHPDTKDLWFTENGRDWLGDDQPPDELNRLSRPGQHFGYPYCHGGTISDPEFGKTRPCNEFTAPELILGPHVASLGMRFYTGSMFPEEYRNRIFIAEHGSWNRKSKIGYRVTLASRDQQGKLRYSVFAEGWLQGETSWGRPADILVMPDGALLVSDDSAGVIYRISYRKP